jgi:hypothetical protein
MNRDGLSPIRGVLWGLLFAALLWLVLIGLFEVARASTTSLRYRTADGRVIVVRGAGCMSEEDSSVLHLVDYVGSSKAIYRCVKP